MTILKNLRVHVSREHEVVRVKQLGQSRGELGVSEGRVSTKQHNLGGGFLILFSAEMCVLELYSEYFSQLESKLRMSLLRAGYSCALCCIIAIDKHTKSRRCGLNSLQPEETHPQPSHVLDESPTAMFQRTENKCTSRGSSFTLTAPSGNVVLPGMQEGKHARASLSC